VEESGHSCVYGVLYEIPSTEKKKLDQAEGLGYGYDEKQVHVELGTITHKATAYYATNTDQSLQPFTWYKALVVAGAVQHGLPPNYIEMLRAAPAKQDTDAQRHAKHMALAGEA
jgi:gamma-glutamylcyclotransferase